jgi:protein arginine kinase activator
MVGMLGKALLGMHEAFSHADGLLGAPEDSSKVHSCPSCGWTVQEFKKTSRFGCPDDYKAFPEFVEEILERVQGATEHPLDDSETELVRAQQEMAEAISSEDYEKAARLKNQISALESELDSTEGLDF